MKRSSFLKKTSLFFAVLTLLTASIPVFASGNTNGNASGNAVGSASPAPEFITDQNFDGLETGVANGTGFNGYVSNNEGVSGKISVAAEDDGNKYLRYEKTCESGGKIPCYSDLAVSGNALKIADDFVIEFRFKAFGPLLNCTLAQGRKVDANKNLQMQDYLLVRGGNITTVLGDTVIKEPVVGRWYLITLAIHEGEDDRNFDVYVDGKWLYTVPFTNNAAKKEFPYTCIRCLNLTGMSSACTVGMDDLRIYNATVPVFDNADTPGDEPDVPDVPSPGEETKPGGNTDPTKPTIPEDAFASIADRYIKKHPEFTATEPLKAVTSAVQAPAYNEKTTDKIYIVVVSAVAVAALVTVLISRKAKAPK